MRLRALLVTVCVLSALGVAAGRGASSSGGTVADAPVTVRMGEFFYRPSVVTVHVGQPVRIVNVGKIVHTVADADARGNVRSKIIRPRRRAHGQAQVVRFTRAGTVRYLCTFHPTLMKGRIVVVK